MYENVEWYYENYKTGIEKTNAEERAAMISGMVQNRGWRKTIDTDENEDDDDD